MIKFCRVFQSSIRSYSSKSKKKQLVEEYLKKQASDFYSRLAKEHSYRARSAFKLLAINEKHNIIFPGDVVVDIGAAPGSWSQVAAELVFDTSKISKKKEPKEGYVLGVDLQPLDPLPNIDFIGEADITRRSTHKKIREKLNGRLVDVLISDMAPNPTGHSPTDHFRLVELCRLLIRLSLPEGTNYATTSDPGFGVLPLQTKGKFLCKVFNGELIHVFMDEIRHHFKSVQLIKPAASRETSSEMYILAKTPIT
ncbi:hypothetical protein FO519_002246 [Halicephalobus sp. NKZ332]|nr:hypothetical protein FO519_002246 [Halicephalobus sp. NKZ332]